MSALPASHQTISFLMKRFAEAGVDVKAKHGQNFLIDLNLLGILVDAAELDARDVVLEVGTGTGSLTGLLAQRVRYVRVPIGRVRCRLITTTIGRSPEPAFGSRSADCKVDRRAFQNDLDGRAGQRGCRRFTLRQTFDGRKSRQALRSPSWFERQRGCRGILISICYKASRLSAL